MAGEFEDAIAAIFIFLVGIMIVYTIIENNRMGVIYMLYMIV